MKVLIMVCGLIWTATLAAQPAERSPDEAEQRTEQTRSEAGQDAAAESPDSFTPSERIQADTAVDFPADI